MTPGGHGLWPIVALLDSDSSSPEVMAEFSRCQHVGFNLAWGRLGLGV